MKEISWIIILCVTTFLAIIGWVITVVRDIKKTAVDLKQCVAEHDVRIAVIEKEYEYINKALSEIKELVKIRNGK
jgi:hypothetical protein